MMQMFVVVPLRLKSSVIVLLVLNVGDCSVVKCPEGKSDDLHMMK